MIGVREHIGCTIRSGLNGDVITDMTAWLVPVPIGITCSVPHKKIQEGVV